jgi:replicative DNA helicase|tara:strand:- start:387 stop:1733 length:1347 start_codon:yes stop_codon:yes gene_type:complete
MADSLNDYGPTFQTKILSSLLTDKVFISTIIDIIEVDYFQSDANKWIVKTIEKYFMEYKTPPSLDALKVELKKLKNDVLQVAVVEALKSAWTHRESDDLEYVKDEILDFCKNQKLKKAILESVDLLENKDYDGIKMVVDTAMRAGTTRDLGHDYISGFEERLETSARKTTPTPWPVINDIMDGGLGGGELGVMVAPAGIGKTWFLQTVGADAIKKGMKVVHYTLELNQAYVGLRYDTIISGINTQQLKYYKEDVQSKLFDIQGNLMIKYYPTRTASVQTISSHLKQLELIEFKPDVIVVDYADILKPISNYREKRLNLGETYEHLRGMAGEFDVPVWTASQANRSSLEEEVIGADKVSEDYSKVMTADFVMSISRKVEDKVANLARVHIIKNRFGVDGVTYPTDMNTDIGKIMVNDSNTKQGQIASEKMNNSEEYLRKMAKNRFDNLG